LTAADNEAMDKLRFTKEQELRAKALEIAAIMVGPLPFQEEIHPDPWKMPVEYFHVAQTVEQYILSGDLDLFLFSNPR
jgi:hypothetical protein